MVETLCWYCGRRPALVFLRSSRCGWKVVLALTVSMAWAVVVSQQLLSEGCDVQEFRCEYEENGSNVVIRGYLRDLHRTVGSRHVLLDGVPGHFQISDDEHASVQFVQGRATAFGGLAHV